MRKAKMNFINPPTGVYMKPSGKLFILRNQDGPYQISGWMKGMGYAAALGYISTYTYEDETGAYPETTIKEPFNAWRLGDW